MKAYTCTVTVYILSTSLKDNKNKQNTTDNFKCTMQISKISSFYGKVEVRMLFLSFLFLVFFTWKKGIHINYSSNSKELFSQKGLPFDMLDSDLNIYLTISSFHFWRRFKDFFSPLYFNFFPTPEVFNASYWKKKKIHGL